MEQLKEMKDQLTSLVQNQLVHTDCVDTKELGEAVDMIKDLAEAIYYCNITEAMEDSKNQKVNNTYYYTLPYDDYNRGRMYYSGSQSNGTSSQGSDNMGGSRYYMPRTTMYDERPWTIESSMMQSDPREGRAGQARRMYIESKQMHKDQGTQMKELEKYMQELGEDITEMIGNATPEEKQILQQKIAMLSSKIR